MFYLLAFELKRVPPQNAFWWNKNHKMNSYFFPWLGLDAYIRRSLFPNQWLLLCSTYPLISLPFPQHHKQIKAV